MAEEHCAGAGGVCSNNCLPGLVAAGPDYVAGGISKQSPAEQSKWVFWKFRGKNMSLSNLMHFCPLFASNRKWPRGALMFRLPELLCSMACLYASLAEQPVKSTYFYWAPVGALLGPFWARFLVYIYITHRFNHFQPLLRSNAALSGELDQVLTVVMQASLATSHCSC